jgi:lipid II:glycine glycyltransferase (peptidoglycan interpeptide bridge formation enzyme)
MLMESLRRDAEKTARRIQIRDEMEPGTGFETQGGQWLHATQLVESPEMILKGFHPDVRRCIKKARGNGLTNEIRTDAAAMDAFYDLHLQTRRRQGVPIQPRRYFALFLERIIQQGLGFVALTRRGQQCLSAGVFCQFKETVLYKYGASDPDGLALFPNYLMLWESMLHARGRKMKLFDFGKTSDENEGLRFFKNKWNSEEAALSYSYFPEAPSSGLHDAILSRLLKPMIQRSPRFVCRLSGEMLYKHFAS